MFNHIDICNRALRSKIRTNKIRYGGNLKLKIYGHLNCKSGKRMKPENRIFFTSKKEAINNNFRPCGHCMKDAYNKWKNEIV